MAYVLVDATPVPADLGGVGRYVDGLLGGLGAIQSELVIVCKPSDRARFAALAPNARVVTGPVSLERRPVRLAWEQVGLPRLARSLRVDVVHSVHYTMPLRSPCPAVVTLHDATFFTQPDVHTRIKGPFFRSAIKTALRRAARCVVPSAATRDDLVRVAGADPNRIDVAYLGVDRSIFSVPTAEEKQRVRNSLGLGDQPYIAFLGTIEPRKNVSGLIRGWVSAVADEPDPPALVLAGGAGWDQTVDAEIAKVPAHLRVMRTGYLPLKDLSGYLGGATLVAYPTHGEGFGLPVLEGMSCGAAVLTTRKLSIPEVGGDAVAYTDVDPAAIADNLRELLADPQRRELLGKAAQTRAADFTWEATARAHLAAYSAASQSVMIR